MSKKKRKQLIGLDDATIAQYIGTWALLTNYKKDLMGNHTQALENVGVAKCKSPHLRRIVDTLDVANICGPGCKHFKEPVPDGKGGAGIEVCCNTKFVITKFSDERIAIREAEQRLQHAQNIALQAIMTRDLPKIEDVVAEVQDAIADGPIQGPEQQV